MATEKGWFIRMKMPNDQMLWSIRGDVSYTHDVDQALLFARRIDAEDYFSRMFHESVKENFEIGAVQ